MFLGKSPQGLLNAGSPSACLRLVQDQRVPCFPNALVVSRQLPMDTSRMRRWEGETTAVQGP